MAAADADAAAADRLRAVVRGDAGRRAYRERVAAMTGDELRDEVSRRGLPIRRFDLDPAQFRGYLLSLGPPPEPHLAAVGAAVVAVLRGRGWAAVRRADVADRSGGGAGRTYRVVACGGGAAPAAVALHLRAPAADPASEARMAAAAELFASKGLGPRRLAQGDDWFIEPWVGSQMSTPSLKEHVHLLHVTGQKLPTVEDLGALLAEIHKLPTEWFDPWREKSRARHPAFGGVPPGSHVWWIAARPELFAGLDDGAVRRWVSAGPAPRAPAAARLVTCHGDFHLGNMVIGDRGVQMVDFELSLVTHAVHDIAYAFLTWLHDAARKRAFVGAYLRASAQSARVADVDRLVLEGERYRLCCYHKSPRWAADDGGHYQALVALADEALSLPPGAALREAVIADGVEACAAGRASGAARRGQSAPGARL